MIEDPEAPHAHRHKSGVAWLDLALAFSVIVLSGASLLTAQHTGHTMEKLVEENSRLVRANSTPVLQFLTGNVGAEGREISLNVSNVGTGAARVIWLEVVKDGRARRDGADLIDYQPDFTEQDYLPTRPAGGTYLAAGDSRPIVSWKYPRSAVSQGKWKAFDQARDHLVVNACFCSVLSECWTSHLKGDLPHPVRDCELRGHVNLQG